MEVVHWIKEGNIQELRTWLEEADETVAAQHKSIAFGEDVFSAGFTLFLWAVEVSNQEIGDLLLKYYPDLLNKGDSEGATPLHYASMNGDTKMVQYLLSKGCKITVDKNGETPIHLACLNGYKECVQILINAGVDLNTQSELGSTALHHAVVNKHLPVISLLLRSKINPNLKDKSGRNALQHAIESGDQAVMDYFEPEKRRKMEELQLLQDQIQEYKEKLNTLQERRENDQRAITAAYKKLHEEEQAHKVTKEVLEKLIEESRHRTLTEEQERYKKLEIENQNLKNQIVLLQQNLDDFSEKKNHDEKTINKRVTDAHRSLSSLLEIFDTAQLAIVHAKTEVEAVREFMKISPEKSEQLVSPQKNEQL